MGIEFREGSLTITPTCHAVATKGMIFNVNIGFSGLVNKEASDSKGKEVALFIGDTILVCFILWFNTVGDLITGGVRISNDIWTKWGSEYGPFEYWTFWSLDFKWFGIQMVGLCAMSYVLDWPFEYWSGLGSGESRVNFVEHLFQAVLNVRLRRVRL